MPRRPFLTRLATIAMLLLVLWAGIDLFFVLDGAETDYAAPADVILVLGCHAYEDGRVSECIQARAAHAADLYRRGLAPRVITSGGATQRQTSEAEVLAGLLEDGGVPRPAILVEDRSRNTIQNMLYTGELLRERGWRTVLLVTEPHHVNRAALIARDNGLLVFPSPAVDSPGWRTWHRRIFNVGRDTLSTMYYQVKKATGTADR